MNFIKPITPSTCPISYVTELIVESVGRGNNPPRKAGSIISRFTRDDAIISRKEGFAMAYGWDVMMKSEYDDYSLREYHNLTQIRRKHYHNYNAYTINIYCVVRDDFGNEEKRLIWQLGSRVDFPSTIEGQIWEHNQYESRGMINRRYVDRQLDSQGFECWVVYTPFDIIELHDAQELGIDGKLGTESDQSIAATPDIRV